MKTRLISFAFEKGRGGKLTTVGSFGAKKLSHVEELKAPARAGVVEQSQGVLWIGTVRARRSNLTKRAWPAATSPANLDPWARSSRNWMASEHAPRIPRSDRPSRFGAGGKRLRPCSPSRALRNVGATGEMITSASRDRRISSHTQTLLLDDVVDAEPAAAGADPPRNFFGDNQSSVAGGSTTSSRARSSLMVEPARSRLLGILANAARPSPRA